MLVFAAAGKLISAFARNKEVENLILQLTFLIQTCFSFHVEMTSNKSRWMFMSILSWISLTSGGDALPRTQTWGAPAASSGWSFGLCWQWGRCHCLGRPRRRWGCRTFIDHCFCYICSHPSSFFCASDIYLRLEFNPASFDVSAMMHPSTYLNKVLFGSSQGALQLWNIKTRLAS